MKARTSLSERWREDALGGAAGLDESIWVAELRISDRTAQKISGRHGVDRSEVRDAVVCVEGLDFAWDDDPAQGLRALVRVWMRGRRWLVVLFPVEHPMGDVWHLGSMYED